MINFYAPSGLENNDLNKVKTNFAKIWARSNNYIFKIINNDWFYKNYNSNILIGQPDEN